MSFRAESTLSQYQILLPLVSAAEGLQKIPVGALNCANALFLITS
jgi:hypothetical protein